MEWVLKNKSGEYYALYNTQGPIITSLRDAAYKFPTANHAKNVRDGDERLKTFEVAEA